MEILQPPGWLEPRGYANGVAATGRQVYVAGQVGWDEQCRFHTDDFVGQARQALRNVVAVLAAAGAKPEHIARMTWYVTSKREYLAAGQALGAAYREIIGRHFPAMTAVEVSALIEDRDDVPQRLARLRHEVIALEAALLVPADLPGDVDLPPGRGDAVRVTAGLQPARRLEDFHRRGSSSRGRRLANYASALASVQTVAALQTAVPGL